MNARIEMLEKLGFTSKFILSNGHLKSNDSKNSYDSKQVKVINFYTFISDDDKNFEIYAIQTVNGEKGMLITDLDSKKDENSLRFISEIVHYPT